MAPLLVLAPLIPLISFTIAFPSADILIVGGGTAGCVLAARLCTNRPNLSIHLLERGLNPNATQRFVKRSPRNMWTAWTTNHITELFPTLPNNATKNRVIMALTGATLGGSSAMNARQWVVPVRGSVERWRIRGLTTDSARTYFTRAFRTIGIAAQKGNLRHIYTDDFLKAARKAGFEENGDPFDTDDRFSSFESRLSISPKGFNVNSCDAYITPVLNSCNNLKVMQGITVSKVFLKKQGRRYRATGVEYIHTADGPDGKRHRMRAAKQVICTAGPFGSPKLLQLSGIGPRQVLKDAGIALKVELPVGQKTQARGIFRTVLSYKSPLEPSNNSTLLQSASEMARWERGDGGVWGKLPVFGNGRVGRDAYFAIIGNLFGEQVDQKLLEIGCFGNVKSFGFLKITSPDPFQSPTVDFGLLQNRKDILQVMACMRKTTRMVQFFPEKLGVEIAFPHGGQITEESVRENLDWGAHYVGGNRIGSVLNSNFKVKGVSGLRVVDSSSLSRIPTSSGLMASVYMVAEYAAELLAHELS